MASIRKRNWKTAKGKERTAYTVDYTDSYGGRQRKQFVRWKEADSFRIKIEGQLSKGTYRPDAEKLTTREACEAFLHKNEDWAHSLFQVVQKNAHLVLNQALIANRSGKL